MSTSGKFNHLLLRLFKEVRPYRKLLIISFTSVLSLAILGPLRPWLIGKAVDEYIIKAANSTLLLYFLGGVFALLILESIFIWLGAFYANLLAQSVIRDLRIRVFNKILRFKAAYFDSTPVGISVTRIVSDVEAISEVFSSGLMEILGDLVTLIVILGFMVYVDWQLTLLALIPIPILIIATRIFAKAMKKSFQMERTQVSRLNTYVQEHLMGIGLIQLFNREEKTGIEFEEINRKHRQAHINAVWANSIFFPVVELLSSLSIGFLLVWGALMVGGKSQTELTKLYGTIISFTLWIQQLYRPIRQLADKFNIIQRGAVRAERLFAILDDDEQMEAESTSKAEFVNGNIQLDKVTFAYVPGSPVLHSLSLTIEASKMTAIVGATGSGKTTIISLLGRFYDPQEGHITIGGVDIQNISREALNRNIGFVLQDVFLFSDTVHNNITLGNPNISREKVIQASKKIGVHDFIQQLPGQYDYVIGERGGALSTGQRQLLAFVRVLVYEPTILILDEATSSVDSESELLIQKAITEVTQNRCSIVIAHRLSTIQRADRICLMEKGQIIESGTHRDLIDAKGAYYQLFEKQYTNQP
jgi:ATP-binding cassette subfamily B protein